MRKTKKISFEATKIVKKPTTVTFKTKSGKPVTFKATKLTRKPKRVSFFARK